MSIYDSLNPEQRKAVFHDKGPLLILAGAGSGKTRVLTHRICYLVEELGVNPYQILAITFTNKAAKEMRERVDRLVSANADDIWVSTFHSTCVRFLRRFIDKLGYGRNFTIYDTDDQKTLMHEVCKFLDIDTKNTKERTLLNIISSAKNELISAEEYENRALGDYNKQKYARVYREYQKRLRMNNAMDFDDILSLTVELFQCNPDVLDFYRRRFRYIMVDEYQDTNTAQFKLISLLSSFTNEYGETEHNLCVVGDDDQSIYKFRGANIYNILNFEDQYPDAVVIRLEQNYRSTKAILNVANEVIHNNVGRKEKTLWTANDEGSAVDYERFETDYDEASAIAEDVFNSVSDGKMHYKDFAILYRTNAQSRIFEEKLVLKGIPYKIIGGVNFYQRKEIKDLLAYLKIIDNSYDAISAKRIINVPKRSIGLSTLDKIDEYCSNNEIGFFAALSRVEFIQTINASTSAKVRSFVNFIEGLRRNLDAPGYSLKDLINSIIQETAYMDYLQAQCDTDDEFVDRSANIDELINKIVTYQDECEGTPSLNEFLEELSLVADIDGLNNNTDIVVLMTIHNAKGLEFPHVYLVGMEEGIFPGYMSINADDPVSEIEEERRLCYVGITRAQKFLTLSSANRRMVRGEAQYNKASRFIDEIPRYLLHIKSSAQQRQFNKNTSEYIAQPSKPVTKQPVKAFVGSSLITPDYTLGDKVRHLKFGCGTVTAITPGGRDYEVTVDFGENGTRKMLASFARLIKEDN